MLLDKQRQCPCSTAEIKHPLPRLNLGLLDKAALERVLTQEVPYQRVIDLVEALKSQRVNISSLFCHHIPLCHLLCHAETIRNRDQLAGLVGEDRRRNPNQSKNSGRDHHCQNQQ